ncbi:hypothetical protein BD410DRAFT_21669 [Rickenella mellea]|uniref:Uncharacterized protein n=1 Tax=Rickenella mellea TaxID=50990 RepID=A0A4R5XGC1_9AGAM|nr:hypothetical protein BD410DRAFT_21669 [Rickenella mellea]
MHLLLATLLLTAIAEAQAESPPRLLHRVFHPSIPIAPFQLRASVHISDNIATIQSAKSFSNDINQFIRDSVHEKNALYLLALAPHGSEDEGTWAVSSVKAVSASYPLACPHSHLNHFSAIWLSRSQTLLPSI